MLSKTDMENMLLEKFTYSNAIALSVKLGIWEASLDRYIDSIDYLSNDLKSGKKIRLIIFKIDINNSKVFLNKTLLQNIT